MIRFLPAPPMRGGRESPPRRFVPLREPGREPASTGKGANLFRKPPFLCAPRSFCHSRRWGQAIPSQQWSRCRVNDNDGHEFADDTVDREAFDLLTAARLTEHGEILDSRVRFRHHLDADSARRQGIPPSPLQHVLCLRLKTSGTR